MKYHCTWCDYIYDELIWDDDLGIEPHTYFDTLPSDFFCPVCDTYKDDFTVFEEEIHTPFNRENLTPLEQRHFPKFEIQGDTLIFEIDDETHGSESDHFLYKVSLFEDGEEIESRYFEVWDEKKWTFDIDYLDEIELRVYCSKEWVFSTWIISLTKK